MLKWAFLSLPVLSRTIWSFRSNKWTKILFSVLQVELVLDIHFAILLNLRKERCRFTILRLLEIHLLFWQIKLLEVRGTSLFTSFGLVERRVSKTLKNTFGDETLLEFGILHVYWFWLFWVFAWAYRSIVLSYFLLLIFTSVGLPSALLDAW